MKNFVPVPKNALVQVVDVFTGGDHVYELVKILRHRHYSSYSDVVKAICFGSRQGTFSNSVTAYIWDKHNCHILLDNQGAHTLIADCSEGSDVTDVIVAAGILSVPEPKFLWPDGTHCLKDSLEEYLQFHFEA